RDRPDRSSPWHGTSIPEPSTARGQACAAAPHEVPRLLRSAGGSRRGRRRLERRSRRGAATHVARRDALTATPIRVVETRKDVQGRVIGFEVLHYRPAGTGTG